jgi:hypothetical protein
MLAEIELQSRSSLLRANTSTSQSFDRDLMEAERKEMEGRKINDWR